LREQVDEYERRVAQRITIVADERFWVCNLPGGSSEVPFPVLTDSASTVSATYGVAFQDRSWHGWTSRSALFVIGRKGILRVAWRHNGEIDDHPPDVMKVIDDLAQVRSD